MRDLTIKPAADIGSRSALAGVVLGALLVAFFGAKWQIGDMFGTLTSPADPAASEVADAALALAPSDPAASNLRAEVGPDGRSSDKRTAVEMAEDTVRLAPNDYRWRIDLARALTADEEFDRAEAEFKRAIELAPNYAICRWYYGNFLMRQERRDEAIAQFKLAADDHPSYRRQVLSLLWDYTGKDASLLSAIAGTGTGNRSEEHTSELQSH